MKVDLPPGWAITGQLERGEQGTIHYQAMLTTPQVRASAVKKVYPRAHIEVARNRTALANYVHKADTRVAEVPRNESRVPTIFQYQSFIADRWNKDDWADEVKKRLHVYKGDIDELALKYVDRLVAEDIENGRQGVEYIAINPMWRSSWKKFWSSIIARNASNHSPAERQESSSAGLEAPRSPVGGDAFHYHEEQSAGS